MGILARVLLGLAALVLTGIVLLALAVAFLFDPKDYQPLLAETVERTTGRKLRLEGDLGLDFFPCCAVTLGPAALGNPPGFPEGDFASVESAALSLKVWPLIARREVEIGAVRLDGLDAALVVRADGAANWEFDTAPSGEAAAATAGPATGRLAIESIAIRDGRVSYRDEQGGSDYLAEGLALETGELVPGEPFDLSLVATLTDRSDGTTGAVKLEGVATLDAGLGKLSLARPAIGIEARGASIPARELRATVGAESLAIDLAEDTVFAFRGLDTEFSLPGLETPAGDATGSLKAAEARFAIGKSTELTLPALEADVAIGGEAIPGGKITARITTGAVAFDVDKLWGSVDALDADLGGLGARLRISGGGRLAESGANLAGRLALEPVSLRSLFVALGESEPSTADPKALTRLEGQADWALGKDSLRLAKLDARLDDTRITGSLGVDDFDAPLTRFDLALDAIDADRYLAPEPAAAPAGTEAGAGGEAAGDIPVETIRDLRLDGRLAIGALRFAGTKLTDVAVTVRAADGRLRLDPLSAGVFGGGYRGAVTIDATGPVARLALEQRLEALQVGAALKELYQRDELTGALSGQIEATATGNTTSALLRTLGGNVALDIAEGAYLGTDLWHEIRKARALIRRDPPPAAPANPQTKFDKLGFAGPITDGVLRTDRLLAEIPFIRLSGSGALDLVGRTIDYRLRADVIATPTFEDGTTFDDLAGLGIPLTLKGPMDRPTVGVELKSLAAGAATQKLKERLLKKLGGDEPDGAGTGAAPEGEQAAPAEPPKEEKPRDILKRSLRDLLKQQP